MCSINIIPEQGVYLLVIIALHNPGVLVYKESDDRHFDSDLENVPMIFQLIY